MLTGPGFLWMLMEPCVFAPVTRTDAPAVASTRVLSHRVVALQLSPLHGNPGSVDPVNTSSAFLFGFNHILSALLYFSPEWMMHRYI